MVTVEGGPLFTDLASAHFTFISPNPLLSICLSKSFTSIMNWPLKLFFTAFLIAAAAIDGTQADATVSGTVFCDQCKDGQISMFDYPLYGKILRLIFLL